MQIEKIVKNLSLARIVDLSKKAIPGRAEGPLDTGERKYEIKAFNFPPGEIMHNIEMESHISTHLEAPSHFVPVRYGRKGKDVTELDLRIFFGLATLVDCQDLKPKTAIGKKILRSYPIEKNLIVLFGRCPHVGKDRCYLAREGAEFLVEGKIKMVGFDDTVFPENPKYAGKDLTKYSTHDLMLSNNIPIIEGLANLDKLKQKRFLFFGFPAKMGGLEAFPIRAVAIEVV